MPERSGIIDRDTPESLTKAELAEMLHRLVGFNKREAKELVDAFFEEIIRSLVTGRSVKLSGFGSFMLRDKPQRPGRNPKTGEEVPISARRVVTFHASQKLKEFVERTSVEQSLCTAYPESLNDEADNITLILMPTRHHSSKRGG